MGGKLWNWNFKQSFFNDFMDRWILVKQYMYNDLLKFVLSRSGVWYLVHLCLKFLIWVGVEPIWSWNPLWKRISYVCDRLWVGGVITCVDACPMRAWCRHLVFLTRGLWSQQQHHWHVFHVEVKHSGYFTFVVYGWGGEGSLGLNNGTFFHRPKITKY